MKNCLFAACILLPLAAAANPPAELTPQIAAEPAKPQQVAVPQAQEIPEQGDFIAFAGGHCRAFLAEGKGDFGFVLSKRAAARFSPAQQEAFNRAFARKLVAEYRIDAAKSCALNTLNVKPVNRMTHAPKTHDRRALPPVKHEIAVVGGQLASTAGEGVPVSIAYRLERYGTGRWVITNITFNGQPMVDRYREEYDALAAKKGAEGVLEAL